ncbi:YciI family protein [Bradyrhizobium barranii]|uniref:YciI family protein n=1 Tax=Bradyrhizobium barranii TaxID=2992140 RepID=UPI0039C883D5
MQYLLMIYQKEAEYANMRSAAGQQMTAEYQTFTQSIIQSGNFKAGDRLQPTTTATTDGPFAETLAHDEIGSRGNQLYNAICLTDWK